MSITIETVIAFCLGMAAGAILELLVNIKELKRLQRRSDKLWE